MEHCWEFIKCGREIRNELGICPAVAELKADGLNRGKTVKDLLVSSRDILLQRSAGNICRKATAVLRMWFPGKSPGRRRSKFRANIFQAHRVGNNL